MSQAQFLIYFQSLLKYITSRGIIFKGHKLCVSYSSFFQYSVSALFILQSRSTSYRCTVIHVIWKEILYCLLLLWLPRRVIDRVPLESTACLWAFTKIYSRISGMFYGGQIFIQVYGCILSFFLDKKENSSFYLKVIQIICYKL